VPRGDGKKTENRLTNRLEVDSAFGKEAAETVYGNSAGKSIGHD